MRLSCGQKEYLLELLYGEYYLQEEYHSLLFDAIHRYAIRKYTNEEIQLLCKNHQSLTSALYLKHTTFSDFRRFFYLWLNLLEYNICIDDKKTITCVLNPDPFSKVKLLRLIKNNGSLYLLPLTPIHYSQTARKNLLLPQAQLQNNTSPLLSFLTQQDAETLLRQFLTIAKNTHLASNYSLCGEDYLQYLAEQFACTQKYIFSWSTLYQKAQHLFTIDENYLFTQKEQGLLLPSNIHFLNTVNAHTAPRHHTNISNSPKTFFTNPLLLQKLKSALCHPPALPCSFKLPPQAPQPTKKPISQLHFPAKIIAPQTDTFTKKICTHSNSPSSLTHCHRADPYPSKI